MLGPKNGGKTSTGGRSTSRGKPRPSQPLSLAQVLKGLSFSFYGEETLRRQKQIILDPYEFLDQLPAIAPAGRERARKKRGVGQGKEAGLKLEGLFLEGKCDEIELATTNDSRIEYRPAGKKGRKSSMGRRESASRGSSDRQRCRSVCSQPKHSEKKMKKK